MLGTGPPRHSSKPNRIKAIVGKSRVSTALPKPIKIATAKTQLLYTSVATEKPARDPVRLVDDPVRLADDQNGLSDDRWGLSDDLCEL